MARMACATLPVTPVLPGNRGDSGRFGRAFERETRPQTGKRSETHSAMAIKTRIATAILCFLSGSLRAADDGGPALIPLPQQMELRSGVFTLKASAEIGADSTSIGPARFLAARLRRATGYPLEIVPAESAGASASILLTTRDSRADLGPEGYQLDVRPGSVVIRAPAQAGVFYGVQSLLQLLPPAIFSSNRVTGVAWRMPCMRIEDWPRFKWRGLMLDVSRSFYTRQEVERLLDWMAMQKLNTFHWHLTDDHGWRIEMRKYPKLTEAGAWRAGLGFGLDPKSTSAYGPDGRYGGYYTANDIREVVQYAAARQITIVPEIEMPGHSTAALVAYPELSCTGGPFSIPPQLGVFNGIYDPAKAETFTFLEDVLTEIVGLFPGKYIHLGGDEVPKDTWRNSPDCQALMKREGLSNENELQGWFMRRMERCVLDKGRIPIGWSEILQGGLASNTVVMDWIGGATEAANSGHDVVMASHRSCYLCYYPSLDRPPELRAYRPYLPLSDVYAFEPIPTNLESRSRSHILGLEACLWTPYIPSMSELEALTFPRLSALAEVGWSANSARQFEDFSRRLKVQLERFDECGAGYWKDDAVRIGGWKSSQIQGPTNLLEFDATNAITGPGKYRLSLDYTGGRNALTIAWAAVLEDGREMARDAHPGSTGTSRTQARDWNYYFDLPVLKDGARHTVRVSVTGEGGHDSQGVVFLARETAR
jgi:hexosaminidase